MGATLLDALASREMAAAADRSLWTPHEERLLLPTLKPKDRRGLLAVPHSMRNEVGAVTAPGVYGPTLEKVFLDTIGLSIESETAMFVMMVTDSYTHNYDTHDFRDDITNEVTGTNYTSGGKVITSTEVTLSSGLFTYDAADVSWASSTIANAMAAVGYYARGGASTADEVLWLSDFVTAASTTNGTFTIQWHANGIFTIDYTP